VIARGTSADLKQQVGGDRVEVTVADPNDAGRVIEVFSSHACAEATVLEDPRIVSIPVLRLDGMVPTAVRELDQAGIRVRDVAGRHATLDDVFFALTGHAAESADEPTAVPA